MRTLQFREYRQFYPKHDSNKLESLGSKLSLFSGNTMILKLLASLSDVQLYSTISDTMDCGPPGSSVHGIFQASILESVAILYSRGSL